MADGIPALEGFHYQSVVALELMLAHFDASGAEAKARPEGIDDLDLVHSHNGVQHRTFVQVKKPRQDAEGVRTPSPWSLSDVLDELLAPRWTELRQENTTVRWVLGDGLGVDSAALIGNGDEAAIWAAQRAGAELLVRARRLAPLPTNAPSAPMWRSPFHGSQSPAGTQAELAQRWAAGFTRRALRAGFDAGAIAAWTTAVERTHAILAQVASRVVVSAPYAEAIELRDRVMRLLTERFGLDETGVRHVVFRNLRGFVDDVARARGTWIDLPKLEDEILQAWPRRLPTVLPPPLPIPHLPRQSWVSELARRPGAVIGPSGAGKTTSAIQLFERLRTEEPDTAVLYAEVREDTRWRSVLEGVALAVGRRGGAAPYALLPAIRAGEDEALLTMADALDAAAIPVALLVDIVMGTASAEFRRDLARFALRLPANPSFRLWVFCQEDALAELSDAERSVRRLLRVPAIGLDWESFLTLAGLHGLEGRSKLHGVYDALTSGRTTGVPPRVADAVLRLGSIEKALAAAHSDDVLLAADTSRYLLLPSNVQTALGAFACLTHPFSEEDAATTFGALAVKAGIRGGIRAGLLHPLGDGRSEFHETVRRNLLAQQPPTVLAAHHSHLAEVYSMRGDRVLEVHHAGEAGLHDRTRAAGRAAFFDVGTANRVSARVAARGWVTPAEVLTLLRGEPNGPHGWWTALHERMDNDTAEGLLSWWRDVLGLRGTHQALWSAPRALLAARPDFLRQLLEVLAASPAQDGRHYGGAALGRALRERPFEEGVVLDRFERGTPEERGALADTLQSSRGPRCIARWLVHLIETNTAPDLLDSFNLSDAHMLAIVEALPDSEPAQLIVRQDWGFGTATAFLWKHREAVGAGCDRLLLDATLEPARARTAFRLLGLSGHTGLFDAARRWARRKSQAQSMALSAPLLVDERAWRTELAILAIDPDVDDSARVAAFATYVQSGEDGASLLQRIVEVSPKLDGVCRLTAGWSFLLRPSLFGLGMLLSQLAGDDDERNRQLVGLALGRASHFADGPHAATVADRLVPLLGIQSPNIQLPVLLALTMLRQPVAIEPCVALAVSAAGTELGGAAAVAACASRPEHLCQVRRALQVNAGQSWLISSLAARLGDATALPHLFAEIADVERPWQTRRRALFALERFPGVPEAGEILDGVLQERPLLGACDTPHGQMSDALARIMQDNGALVIRTARRDEYSFVKFFSDALTDQGGLGDGVTPEQVAECFREVWRTVRTEVVCGTSGGEIVTRLLNRIHCLQVQSAALGVARAGNRSDVLESVLSTNNAPWLVLRAMLDRTRLDPRGPTDAARWIRCVEKGPCRADAALLTQTRHVAERAIQPTSQRPAPGLRENLPTQLSAPDLHALLDAERPPPRRACIGDMDAAELELLVARLDPADDHEVVEVGDGAGPANRVSLTADGARVRPNATRHTGRKGDRPAIRARLVSRFPTRVPEIWITGPQRGHNFVAALVVALADEGDPVRALTVLRMLSDDLTEVVRARTNFYRLGEIADAALVRWISQLAGTGGPSEVEALASFARHAAPDAVLTLLWRLMSRIEGHVNAMNAVVSHEIDDPWRRALVDILMARRLPEVAGAGNWLVHMLTKTPDPYMRERIIDSMAAFPSTWSQVEVEVLRSFEYGGRYEPAFRRAEEIAHQLFRARRET